MTLMVPLIIQRVSEQWEPYTKPASEVRQQLALLHLVQFGGHVNVLSDYKKPAPPKL